jgi:prepilin-type N-terminal cleavage/methylation domain-containing protein
MGPVMRKIVNYADDQSLKSGFTLTELAIVLSVIGLILGAIWAAAAEVYTNRRISKAAEEVLSVVNSVRATYGAKGAIGGSSRDLTAAGINFGWFPVDMIQSVTCVDGVNPCPVTPWGSGMMVVGGGTSTNMIILIQSNPYGTGTGNDCPAFMAKLVSQSSDSHMVGFYSDYSNSHTLVSVSSATALTNTSIANCHGDVALLFSL